MASNEDATVLGTLREWGTKRRQSWRGPPPYGARQRHLTDGQIRARDLELRSFAVASFEALLVLTGIWFFVWPIMLPLLGGLGLTCDPTGRSAAPGDEV